LIVFHVDACPALRVVCVRAGVNKDRADTNRQQTRSYDSKPWFSKKKNKHSLDPGVHTTNLKFVGKFKGHETASSLLVFS
jgi:hypothetical protein